MRRAAALIGGIAFVLPGCLAGQSAETHLSEGDAYYATRDANRALVAYEAAVAAAPDSYEALCKAARSATDLGEFDPVARTQQSYFVKARGFAERAVHANTSGAEGYFQLARAAGRVALAAGVKERVRLAGQVRETALQALARDPNHAGALHILGVWNAEIMRLNGFERLMAKTFLGGKVLGEANWAEAARDLERAVQIEPHRIVHRLDLGRVYKDTGKPDLARAAFEWIAQAPIIDYNDANYKRAASEQLRTLR